jgi:putative RNA 2'-phosphotransferase
MMNKRQITVSKFLAKVLRHEPESLGLKLAVGGWVGVQALLDGAKAKGFPISLSELKEVVATNDKKRFSFDETGNLIRANQGHSTSVDLQLEERKPPKYLYHGTATRNVGAIQAVGISKMGRHAVHLSQDAETARKVGSRHGKAIVLVVEAEEMHKDGHKFYLSDNNVWLTDQVPPQYVHD